MTPGPKSTFFPAFLASFILLGGLAYLSLISGPPTQNPDFTFYQIRLPRFCTASLIGAGLGLCGLLLQLATRNPLAEPELLGINQSAVFFTLLTLLCFGPETHSLFLLLAAFAGGLLSGGLILAMASSGAFPRERLILAGLSVAFFFGSLGGGLLILRESALFEILHWTAGKLSGSNWLDVKLLSVCILPCFVLSIFRAKQWNALSLGEEAAQNLGVNPGKLRVEIVLMASLICAVCVAVAGPIGFLGIVVPHLAHSLAGLDFLKRLPLIVALGSALLVGSDLAARSVLQPIEIPVGVFTALVGAPYFLFRTRLL